VITKGERAELRSLIRQRFRVLRADVSARQAELEAELEERITGRYAAGDKAWADAMWQIEEVAREANRAANDILRTLGMANVPPDGRDYTIVTAREINQPRAERATLRVEGTKKIHAKVASALLQLDRQEADLLTRLVVGALESEEARAFLGEIPTVSELVPAGRLLELMGGAS
jgi:cell division septum initiation protein DivIVA